MSEHVKFSDQSGNIFAPDQIPTAKTTAPEKFIRENIVENLPFFDDETAVMQLSLF